MPPNIVDVVLEAIPWLKGIVDYADIVLTAIPQFGNTSLYLFIGSAFLILMYWFQYES